jgi:hypothetical protein
MTNSEILAQQAAHRAHLAAVPPAIEAARAALADLHGDPIEPTMPVRCIFNTGSLRTLLAELERLQRQVAALRQGLRDEQREAQYAAATAHSEGRHEGLREGRGF